ncbi:Hsp70 family protein [Cryobacterium aureum]|uniref:Hsp70 family protein n=1 Tax=Cryobacterium aureum TaxID=995037 RepID=UPI00137529CB|nr:Hsp70 family protein [Cryobacterium aureum]
MKIPIGIDLGTTFSVVAHVSDDGSIRLLDNDEGAALTPSVVYFEAAGRVVVGTEAKASVSVQPDRVVAKIKREMGRDFALTFDGETYGPEGISAIILRALAQSASRELGVDPADLVAVVTVPAYFGTTEREATAAAAKIAGLSTIDLVAEPVAAALSYGVGVGATDRGSVLVYDLGGGTFDATVIELTAGGPKVVSVDGASQLGGVDFDQILGDLLIGRYVTATGDDGALDDEEFILSVYALAEDVKKKLSRTETASLPLRREGQSAKVAVERAEFTAATANLVNETLTVVDRAIAAAIAKGASRPSQVLLTGGSSRMPAVTSALEGHLRLPVRLSDPDTAVAKGAAIHCRALLRRTEPATENRLLGSSTAERILDSAPLQSVLARALGIKLHDSTDPEGKRVMVKHLIDSNTALPVAGVTARFATVVDGQSKVRIELMEQAGAVSAPDLSFNRRILDGELTGLPASLPAGSPIEVQLTVGLDGRISCIAREPRSGQELTLESYMEGVADGNESEQQQRAVSGLMVRG